MVVVCSIHRIVGSNSWCTYVEASGSLMLWCALYRIVGSGSWKQVLWFSLMVDFAV